ncbi:hypothetical protein [Cytobacillus dafuensis]|uniref:Uncharacterized protein n=1 Tax=Cytobacillus dafuensis TaxID=1742359 RepID=A0A5B8Z2E1_CYTDA|nr:hypothetical protein [Cytobacillus dafuensis]QED46443.1 hypothetical protein FSZ17_03710 [Cytobacillus dafuensis]
MDKRLADIEQRLTKEYKDIAIFVKHVFDEYDIKTDEHRRLIASNALAGIKTSGVEEKVFYDMIQETKRWMLDVLERTAQDFEHKGDKYWNKNFPDGTHK